MSLPGADELFRATVSQEPTKDAPAPVTEANRPEPSGRVKHDEKVTVYLTADELMDLEQARVLLRRELAQTVDRGRLVRAAITLALADLDSRGSESDLARRLRQT